MSDEDDRNDVEADLLAGQDGGKTNAEIEQQARIDAVLETMLGRPLVKLDSFYPGNALAWGMADYPPDFLNLKAPPSYASFNRHIPFGRSPVRLRPPEWSYTALTPKPEICRE